MAFVADASVVASWYFADETGDAADAALQSLDGTEAIVTVYDAACHGRARCALRAGPSVLLGREL